MPANHGKTVKLSILNFMRQPVFETSDLQAVQPVWALCGGTSQGFQQAGMHGTVTGNHITSFQRFIA